MILCLKLFDTSLLLKSILTKLLIFQIYNLVIFIANFNTCKCISGVGRPCRWVGVFPGKEGGIQVLTGLASFSQTLASLLRTPDSWMENFGKKIVWWIQIIGKIHSNYIWLNTFGKVQHSRILPSQCTKREHRWDKIPGISYYVMFLPYFHGTYKIVYFDIILFFNWSLKHSGFFSFGSC